MPEGAPHDPDAHRLGRRYVTLLVAGVSVVALTCVAFLLPAPYVTMRPGPAFDTFGEIGGRQMFTFGKGVKTYPVDGALDFTTVSVTRADTHVSLGSVVEAFLTSDVAVVPRDIVYPDDESAAASKAEGQAQLTSSKDSSLVVALRAAGYRVGERASVAAVAQDGAAAGKLQPKDEITAVDGRRTSSAASVVEAVGRVKPGATVTLDVVRGQLEVVLEDLDVRAVKVGMLGSPALVELVAELLADVPALVVDPVMVSTSGHRLLPRDAEAALRDLLLPSATLVTPNLPEASVLTGLAAQTDPGELGRALLALGPGAVLLKGGHGDGPASDDLLVDRREALASGAERQVGQGRGPVDHLVRLRETTA